MLALNTELNAGSKPQPFAVSGFDKDGNEFDTLDGIQISWFLGATRFAKHLKESPRRGRRGRGRP